MILGIDMDDTICDTICSLCSLSIEYDTHSLTEAQVRSTILTHIIRLDEVLDRFLYLHPDYSVTLPSSLNTAHTMLTTSISWLRYVVTTSSYTDDLTNFAGVLRNTTLNLIFAIFLDDPKHSIGFDIMPIPIVASQPLAKILKGCVCLR